ncbi:MAG: hypothetical protein IT196_04170 [Acidimicrobiales bacterium]|nr:hypothetical protein [Acidimicrobiales bacterium]
MIITFSAAHCTTIVVDLAGVDGPSGPGQRADLRLETVDRLLRVALGARRSGITVHLDDAPLELWELLGLLGLSGLLGRRPADG